MSDRGWTAVFLALMLAACVLTIVASVMTGCAAPVARTPDAGEWRIDPDDLPGIRRAIDGLDASAPDAAPLEDAPPLEVLDAPAEASAPEASAPDAPPTDDRRDPCAPCSTDRDCADRPGTRCISRPCDGRSACFDPNQPATTCRVIGGALCP